LRVASTVVVVQDGDRLVVIDPGFVPDRAEILNAVTRFGGPVAVTDVVFSHHHPDHTVNAALFPDAHYHDHWAIYRHDTWRMRPAEGYQLSPSVSLIETPGHTPQDITTLVATDEGVAACTHLWWSEEGPPEDPFAVDPDALHAGRARVLERANLIVPGHGAPFVPGPGTPR